MLFILFLITDFHFLKIYMLNIHKQQHTNTQGLGEAGWEGERKKEGGRRERKKYTNIFYPVISSYNSHSRQTWIKMKPGTRNFMNGREASTWIILCAFLGESEKAGSKSGSVKSWIDTLIWDATITVATLCHHTGRW